jgi:hypothetical protein
MPAAPSRPVRYEVQLSLQESWKLSTIARSLRQPQSALIRKLLGAPLDRLLQEMAPQPFTIDRRPLKRVGDARKKR